jgi:dihydroorotate dehydrogenase
MTPFLISPPFGSYRMFDYPNATCVLGSFTLNRRPGRWLKTLEFFWDNFREPIPNGWVNRIGLRNPGIGVLEFSPYHLHLYSLVGLEDDDWEKMFAHLVAHADTHIRFELNLGCPNVHEYGIPQQVLEDFCQHYWCGVKLPADLPKALRIAEMAVKAGARYLHAGNTLASSRGGISGAPLKLVNLSIVEALVREFPHINIVGGGGIREFQDVLDYMGVGATAFGLGTICFRPWLARRIVKEYDKRFGTKILEPKKTKERSLSGLVQ